jgi:uncharacterized protein (TIGR03435 family)
MLVHHETRVLPVYALVTLRSGKTGPQLKPHTDDTTCVAAGQPPPPPNPRAALPPLFCGDMPGLLPPSVRGQMQAGGQKVTMEMIATSLGGFDNSLDRPVLDHTDLSGTVDFKLQWTPQFQNTLPNFQPDSSGTSLQDQLGLKLESTTGPVDVLVIVEKILRIKSRPYRSDLLVKIGLKLGARVQ